jgi:hypothetical protein
MLATPSLSLMLGRTWGQSFTVELLAYLLFHSNFSVFFDFLFKYANILHIIHSFNYLHPLHGLHTYLIPEHIFNHPLQLVLALEHVSVTDHLPEQLMRGVPEGGLHVAEVLVDLVPQHLPEQADVRALSTVPLDCTDDGRGPVDDQGFQAVPLVQVGVHELLHGFPWLGAL